MSPRPATLSPTIALFGIAAMLALFLVSGGALWLLAALAILILASYVLRLRLPTTWLPSLLFGGILVGMAILSTPLDGPHAPAMIGTARATFLFGEAAAVLMTIQFYRPTPGDALRPGLFALLGGMLTLMAACNTFEERSSRFILPLTVALTGVALRSLKAPSIAQNGRRLLFMLPTLLAALIIGWFGIQSVRQNRERLMEWGNRFMNERPPVEQIGLSTQPNLGPTFGSRGSNARTLRLEGNPGIFHLRATAYDTYNENQWWPAVHARSFTTLDPQFLSLSLPPKALSNRVVVTRLQASDPLVLFPLETVVLELDEAEQMEWSNDNNGPVRVRTQRPYTYSYQETSDGFQGLMALPGIKTDETRRKYLKLPSEVHDELLPMAQKITAGAQTSREKVQAVTQYLLENYTYSLTFNGGFIFSKGRPNSVERFVEGKRMDMVLRFLLATPKMGAHCEYFASSAALLLRCVGVPTRYVTGYFAHEQESPTSLIVRQRDAHAWCEAWVDGTGWVTVEATPPSGWPGQNKTPIEPWRRAWEWVQDSWQGLLNWMADREPAQLAVMLMGPFGAIGLVVLMQRLRRKPAPTLLDPLLPPPHLAAYAQRFEATLTPLSPTEPWSESLSALPEAVQPAAKRFVALYQKARFGGQSADTAALEEALKTIEAALTKKS